MKTSNFGNAFFGLSFLLLSALVILQLRAINTPEELKVSEGFTLGIHSIDDYEQLVDNQLFPLNKIPEEAHRSIANSLLFNRQNDLVAGSLIEVQTFLNRDEQVQFLSLLFGAKVNFISSRTEERSVRQDSMIRNENHALFLVQELNGKFQILTGV